MPVWKLKGSIWPRNQIKKTKLTDSRETCYQIRSPLKLLHIHTNYRTTEFLMLIPNNARNTIPLKQLAEATLSLCCSLSFSLVYKFVICFFGLFFSFPLYLFVCHSIQRIYALHCNRRPNWMFINIYKFRHQQNNASRKSEPDIEILWMYA